MYLDKKKRFISYYLHLTIASSLKYLKEQDYVKHPTLPNLAFPFIFLGNIYEGRPKFTDVALLLQSQMHLGELSLS